jgi:hypothetical protein
MPVKTVAIVLDEGVQALDIVGPRGQTSTGGRVNRRWFPSLDSRRWVRIEVVDVAPEVAGAIVKIHRR